MSEQNELALVLSRIQALSKAKVSAAIGPEAAIGDDIDDGIPVLTDIYQGQDAFTAVEFADLFALENSASDSHADYAATQQPSANQQDSQIKPAAQPGFERLSPDSSIRFLPVDDGSEQPTEHLEAPEREELVAAVLEDIQPVMSDVIRQALIREVQVLGPRLSAELEAALSESVRLRVLGALKNEKPDKD